MSASFAEDMEYLGKIILLTLLVLSISIIYNQRFIEGIILLTICCQISLIWWLIKNQNISDLMTISKNVPEAKRHLRFIIVGISVIIFLAGFVFLLRAVAIAQHSFIIHGAVKSVFYTDILIAGVLGGVLLGIFFALMKYSMIFTPQ